MVRRRQTYAFAIFGEKASLDEVVLPIAERFEADAYLGPGEISDTFIHRIAKDAVKDGRPLIIFTLTDFDPSGWQMTISIARKLQAFRDLRFPRLRFEVVPVALTIDQVHELQLPSTPLKEGDKRRERWVEAFDVEQTEIDSLTTPDQMDDLRTIIEQAFVPYFDFDLEDRVAAAEAEWTAAAQEAIDEQADANRLAAARERAEELRAAIDELEAELTAIADPIELPPIEVPQVEIDDDPARQALVYLDQGWISATKALIERKKYGNDD